MPRANLVATGRRRAMPGRGDLRASLRTVGIAETGFTLLELLMALSIFAIVSVMAYSGLRAVLEAEAATRTLAQRLGALQFAFGVMQRDLEQAAPRSIRDGYGDRQGALQGSSPDTWLLELTRSGSGNPLGLRRANLRRIAYVVRNGSLLRATWSVLDRADERPPSVQTLVEGVKGATFRFLHPVRGWVDSWPPIAEQADTLEALPRAVEFRATVAQVGPLQRLFRVLM